MAIASQSVIDTIFFCTDHIHMQLAAVVQRCERIKKEATEKAEAHLKEQEKRLRSQLEESQRLRIEVSTRVLCSSRSCKNNG